MISIRTVSFPRFRNQVAINLAANIMQGVIGVALIPLATRVLGPEDYGVYGMAIAVMGLVVALCEMGAAYIIYGHYAELEEKQRRELVSSLIALSVASSSMAALLLWVYWPFLGQFNSLLASLTPLEVFLICLAVPCRAFWALANPVLIAQMRSIWVAVNILIQAIAVFAMVLVALYVFEQERTALFLGNLAGAVACVIVALYAMGRSAWGIPRVYWLRKVANLALGAWFSGLADNIRVTVESGTISRAAGSIGLGNFNHARLYYGFLMQGTNALGNVMWPLALQDARDSSSQFIRIKLAWDIVYLGLTMAGLVFVFFGDLIVSWLTNGKFEQAAIWVPFLVMYLLIQNSGKPATAVLFATNQGNTYSLIRIVSTVSAVVGIVLLVPRFGVAAVIAIAMLEMIMMRVLIQIMARRISAIPFQDQWVILGCMIIAAAWWFTQSVALTDAIRIGFLALTCSVLLVFVGRSVVAYAHRDVSG